MVHVLPSFFFVYGGSERREVPCRVKLRLARCEKINEVNFMNSRLMAKGMFLAWLQMGLKDLKLNGLDFSFSVPSSSFELDKWGNEMSGHLLAKRIKEKCIEMGIPFENFNYTIRNEHWTKEKQKQATVEAKKSLNVAEMFL